MRNLVVHFADQAPLRMHSQADQKHVSGPEQIASDLENLL